jgi:hypothetical protein
MNDSCMHASHYACGIPQGVGHHLGPSEGLKETKGFESLLRASAGCVNAAPTPALPQGVIIKKRVPP